MNPIPAAELDEEGFRLAEQLLTTPDYGAIFTALRAIETPEERMAYLDSIGLTAEAAGREPGWPLRGEIQPAIPDSLRSA